MTKIPSNEEFARAKKLMRERERNIDKVNVNVTRHFKGLCPLHYFILMPQGDNEFWVGIFFNKDKDIIECEENGISKAIQDFVYEELERQERGKREDITVVFEFDSNENVKTNFDGDYFLRLR